MSQQDLEELFEPFGEITLCRLDYDKTGNFLGSATI